MFYKEWLTVRFKLGLWLTVYAVIAFLYVFFWSQYRPGNFWVDPAAFLGKHPDMLAAATPEGHIFYSQLVSDTSFFQENAPMALYYDWLLALLLITPFAAVLGGADVVSEEVDKGTLSFLLTRPVSRTRIYSSKILINCAALAVAIALPSIPVLIYDQLQRKTIPLGTGLVAMGVVIMSGVAVICLGGLLSVYTRNVMQTLGATIFAGLLIFFGLTVLYEKVSRTSLIWLNWTVSSPAFALVAPLLLAIAWGLYLAGRDAFIRKEF